MYRMTPETARAFLAQAQTVRMAFVDPDGRPVMRTLQGVVVDDAIAFHASPVGEKRMASGTRALIAADEVVAEIPSYFVDTARACAASTFYRSVHVEGVVEDVTDPARKARVLQALMEKFQPEGGHARITEDDPMYRASVGGVWIFQVRLDNLSGKAKLGQNRKPEELRTVLDHLWRRGGRGDLCAIDLVRSANPGVEDPPSLAAPAGLRFRVAPDRRAAEEAADLLGREYWNENVPHDMLAAAHSGSTAWVTLHDASDRLVASARAVSDGAKFAWIYDVAVDSAWRGRGLGKALMKVILDHPAVRHARMVSLSTRDAQGLYAQFGFVDRATLPAKPYSSTEMALVRFVVDCACAP